MIKKVYLIIGLPGSGKSTVGNCIINQNGDISSIENSQFKVSDAATCQSNSWKVGSSANSSIIESAGFGDKEYDQDKIFNELKSNLNRVNNKIDCVLFVVSKGRFTNEIVQFFNLIQEKVLQNNCKNNSILIVTKCLKNWISQQENCPEIQNVLNKCNDRYHEFYLKDDDSNDDSKDLKNNETIRQKSIKELVSFIDGFNFNQIDLTYIQEPEFENYWNQNVLNSLKELVSLNPISPKIDSTDSLRVSNREKRVYLMFGLSGSGKSTTANCIFNKSGSNEKIKEKPFLTSDSARNCTDKISHVFNEELHVIDTVGFIDPYFDHSQAYFDQLKTALKEVNNKVDCVLFCVEQQRFTNETVEFFQLIQKKIMRSSSIKNSVLIVTKSTRENWVKENQNCPFLSEILKGCNYLYYEFRIKFDFNDDDDETIKKNERRRKNSILDLVSFLNSQQFQKLEMNYLQSTEYKKECFQVFFEMLFSFFNTKFIQKRKENH